MAEDKYLEKKKCPYCGEGILKNTNIREPGTRFLRYMCNYCGKIVTRSNFMPVSVNKEPLFLEHLKGRDSASPELLKTIGRAIRGGKTEIRKEPLLLEDKNLRSNPRVEESERRSKPSIEGFVLHGHFEGSDKIAYLGAHTGKFGKHRMGVPGAAVRIWGPYADTTTTTDDRGYYSFYGLPEGEYHMRAEKGGSEEVRGGYLADYKDKVTIPRPTKRRAFYEGQWVILEEPHTVRQDFELTPLESVSQKVSFTGGKGQTRDDARRILHEYKDLGYNKADIKQRLLNARRSGRISKNDARDAYEMLKDDTNDLNEIKRKMIEGELKHLGGRDKSFNVRNVRYIPSAIGKVNIFSTITDNFKSKIVTSAALLIVGMIVSALIGSVLFVFAFLCFVISTVLPTPKDYKHVQDRIASISNHYENLKKSEAYHKASDTVLSQLEEQRKNDIMITMSMMRDFKMQDVAVSTVLKESMHVIGLALITIALIMSSVPFAKPIGVIAAIVAYMTIRFERTDTGVHEKSKARWLSRIISQDEV